MRRTPLPLLLTAFVVTCVASHHTSDPPDAAEADSSLTAAAPAGLVTSQIISDALDLACPEVRISQETPLSEVLAAISHHMTEQAGIPIVFVEDLPELEIDGVTSLSEVMVKDLKLPSGSHTCREVIELILWQTADPELTILPGARHILVTTVAASEYPDYYEVRAYDVTPLLREGSAEDVSGPGGETHRDSADARDRPAPGAVRTPGVRFSSARELRQALVKHTASTVSWMEVEGDGGFVSLYGSHLIVRHSRKTHIVIQKFLDDLRNEPRR